MDLAAPQAAPGVVRGGKPLRGSPNINLRGRCGNLLRWFHFHLAALHEVKRRHLSQHDQCHTDVSACQPLRDTVD